MSHLTVPGKELRVALEVLAPMAATGFDVKMLAAVHLRANSEKVTLSATDRYGIGQWILTPTEQDGDVNVAIATSDVKRILTLLPALRKRDEDYPVTISVDGDRITVETENGDRVIATHVEGKTPNFDALFPDERGELAIITLAPEKLSRFTAAQRRIAQWEPVHRHSGMRLSLVGLHKAVVIGFPGLDQFRGLLMPMRD